MPQSLYQTRELQQICGAKTALARGQCSDERPPGEVGPPKWNLALAALFVEERYSVLAAVFFLGEGLKLTTGERVKWMRDPKLLWFYSTNACSATPFPKASARQSSSFVSIHNFAPSVRNCCSPSVRAE